MSKCKKCGRKGLFFKVNSDGLCKDCVTLCEIEKQKNDIQNEISEKYSYLTDLNARISSADKNYAEINNKITNKTNELNSLALKYDDTIRKMTAIAEVKAIQNVREQVNELESHRAELSAEVKKMTSSYNSMQLKYQAMKTQYDSFKWARDNYVRSFGERLDIVSTDNLSPTIEIDLQCMTIRQLKRMFSDNQILIQDCFKRYAGRYTTKANAAIYQLMTISLEAELQNILFSLKFGKVDGAIENIKKMCGKYLSIATDGNQSIAPTIKKFVGEIEYLFIEAVKIEYEYYVQKERIKEEQRAIREQMKQEAEERKALEHERKRIEKEEQKYQNEIEKLKEQLSQSESQNQQALTDRIAELESQISRIEDKREQIVSLENGKAGYVYIVSNIGSFGENIYKIGMTRRLEPMDRVNELGNASVPFPFDVHGMIFSDDAVDLEHSLHVTFNDRRVNKVNLRKEFFNVSLDDIEKIVEKRCPTAEFKRTALAEQYRQSIAMTTAAQELDVDDLKEDVE